MKANYKVLAKIDVELFYCVSIRNHEVTLQGKQSSETVKHLQDKYKISNWTVDTSGFMESVIEINNVKVVIVLT